MDQYSVFMAWSLESSYPDTSWRTEEMNNWQPIAITSTVSCRCNCRLCYKISSDYVVRNVVKAVATFAPSGSVVYPVLVETRGLAAAPRQIITADNKQ